MHTFNERSFFYFYLLTFNHLYTFIFWSAKQLVKYQLIAILHWFLYSWFPTWKKRSFDKNRHYRSDSIQFTMYTIHDFHVKILCDIIHNNIRRDDVIFLGGGDISLVPIINWNDSQIVGDKAIDNQYIECILIHFLVIA